MIDYPHFENKTPPEHLKAARKKGQLASEPTHGVEPSGSIIAAVDSCKDVGLILTLSIILLSFFSFNIFCFLTVFSIALIIWKIARSALLGWGRIERVHRLIQEEQWEIEHHRDQEKIELLELYKAKGFRDKQLEEVVEVLMADDNRLLQVMLEEELGLPLGFFEHPLRQAIGAGIGAIIASISCLSSFYFFHFTGLYIVLFILLFLSGWISAKRLGNNITKSVVWTLSISGLTLGIGFFLMKTLFPLFSSL